MHTSADQGQRELRGGHDEGRGGGEDEGDGGMGDAAESSWHGQLSVHVFSLDSHKPLEAGLVMTYIGS